MYPSLEFLIIFIKSKNQIIFATLNYRCCPHHKCPTTIWHHVQVNTVTADFFRMPDLTGEASFLIDCGYLKILTGSSWCQLYRMEWSQGYPILVPGNRVNWQRCQPHCQWPFTTKVSKDASTMPCNMNVIYNKYVETKNYIVIT